MKEINENIIKTQDEIIEILKSQVKNSNSIIEEQDKMLNMQHEFIKTQAALINDLKKIVYGK